ncbi:MAG TPA: sigma-70 family RNA polymerase sigma factor [Puia sp.]|nr:sigma-70 family RNA polymerase sigma factor [Puia sp.]
MNKKSSSHNFSIDKFRKGDLAEFNFIFYYYYDIIYMFCYNMIGTEAEAQDITSDGFVKLWRLKETFASQTGIQAFLYFVARNSCIDFIRRRKRQWINLKEIMYLLDEEEVSIENAQIEAEVLKEITRQIEGLPDKCREVFKLVFFDSLKTAEIADLMGISPQNVQAQKERAIKLLRLRLIS